MATANLTGGGIGKWIIDVNPKPGDVAKEISRRINKPMKKEVGRLHKKLGEIPVEEIKKRANKFGSGRVRIARSVRSAATVRDLTVAMGGARYPDLAGQEWGSSKYGQFLPWKGAGDDAGYVVGAMQRDDAFMSEFLDMYAEGLTDLISTVIPPA